MSDEMNRELDVDFVRSWFPAFDDASLDGWAFFENAGGSYACRPVIDRLGEYYRRLKVQPYGPYPASVEAGEWMDESYRLLAQWLNVAEHEVYFGPSTSQNTYVLAQALRPGWDVGDRIIVSNQDHEANAGAWRRLADTGIEVVEWRIDPETAVLDLERLDELLAAPGKPIRLIAFPHASNVVADINPVADVAARARAVGAITVVDGVSYAPHGLPDVGALGADIYLFSLYKTWGPHLGLMTVRRPVAATLANQSHFFNADKQRSMLYPAGPDHAQVAAAAGVVHYLDAVHDHHAGSDSSAGNEDRAARGRFVHDLFRRHEQSLAQPLLDWLDGRDDVRVIGPIDAARRAPTVAVVPLARPMDEVISTLVADRLMVGSGDFYAVRPLNAAGVDLDPGVLRMSMVHYNTADEVLRLIAGLERALG